MKRISFLLFAVATCQAADVTYPLQPTETLLIQGGAPTSPTAGQVKIGNGVIRSAISSGNNLLLEKPTGASLQFTENAVNGYQISGDAAHHLLFWSGGVTERMRLTNDGKVGIGTGGATPPMPLTVNGGVGVAGEVFIDHSTYPGSLTGGAYRIATNALFAFSGSNHYYDVNTSKYTRAGGASRIQYDISTGASAGAISFLVAPSGAAGAPISFLEAATITAAGNMGIGTTTPSAKLDICGDAKNLAFLRVGKVGPTPSAFGDWVGIDFLHTNEISPSQQTGNPASRVAAVLERGNNGYGLALTTRYDAGTLTEAVRVSAEGNVGMGTTTPAAKLHLSGGSGMELKMDNKADLNRGFRIAVSGAAGSGKTALDTTSSGYALTFGIDSVEKMRVAANGNVGIGTTTPTNTLTVIGTISAKEIKVTT